MNSFACWCHCQIVSHAENKINDNQWKTDLKEEREKSCDIKWNGVMRQRGVTAIHKIY